MEADDPPGQWNVLPRDADITASDLVEALSNWEWCLTASIAHPREIFKAAILKILSHGHPSGDPTPSREDIQLTERVSKAGEIPGIKLLDHIIIGEQGNYSFSNAGPLP